MKKNSKPNPKAEKKPKTNFQLPQQVLSQLNEFTGGGYILLTVNGVGSPCVYQHFDSAIMSMGLHKFGLEYFHCIDRRENESIMDSIVPIHDVDDDGSIIEDDDEDEDDGEEGSDKDDDTPPEPPEKSVSP